MVKQEKMKLFKVSEFLILPYTQNGKRFTSNFDRFCCIKREKVNRFH